MGKDSSRDLGLESCETFESERRLWSIDPLRDQMGVCGFFIWVFCVVDGYSYNI